MNISTLTETQILNFSSFDNIITDENLQLHLRCRAKELKVVSLFDKKLKDFKKKTANEKIENLNFCGFDEKFDNICTGQWITNESGISKQVPNYETGEVNIVEASRMMIVPTETFKNMDTNIEKIKLCYYKHNSWQNIICDRLTISNLSKIVELSNIGIDVNSLNSKELMQYLYDCLTLNDSNIIPHFKSVSRMGWVDDEFMPYNSDLKFDGENEYKYIYESITKKGELSEWINFIKPLRDNLYFRLQMAASFASILISKVNALPFVFHLWGGTGSGKTVGLMCAMSIWGNPKMGKLTRTMNMTQNSMMSTASFLHNLPFAGDELQTIKSRYDNYDQLIMKITEGVERGRMTFSTVNEIKTWNCSFLFTGEEPCTRNDSGGGTKNRVIEVECVGKVVEEGNKVVNFITQNYGTAGEVFIEEIKKIDLITQYEEILKEILKNNDTTEKQAMAMALIMLADKLSSEFIFNDNALELIQISEFLFSEKEVDISERAYSYILSIIAQNQINFTSASTDNWGQYKCEGKLLFNKNLLHKLLSASGFDFEAVKRKWEAKKYIELNSQGKYAHQRKINGVTTNYILINTDILIDDDMLPDEKNLPW